jgi:hypothetical protein
MKAKELVDLMEGFDGFDIYDWENGDWIGCYEDGAFNPWNGDNTKTVRDDSFNEKTAEREVVRIEPSHCAIGFLTIYVK